jgi:hypothetical protein
MTPIKLIHATGKHRTVIVCHPLLDASATAVRRGKLQAGPSYLRPTRAQASRGEATERSR